MDIMEQERKVLDELFHENGPILDNFSKKYGLN
jgi:hypothetical protein